MIVRDIKRLTFLIGPIIILLILAYGFWDRSIPDDAQYNPGDWFVDGGSKPTEKVADAVVASTSSSSTIQVETTVAAAPLTQATSSQPPLVSEPTSGEVYELPSKEVVSKTHHEVFSLSTPNKRFFEIEFGSLPAFNPNIIPHPALNDTWILVAQYNRTSPFVPHYFEISCNAIFSENVLRCIEEPAILPIAATFSDKCKGDLDLITFSVGPHDARLFYGPQTPFIMYGSNSGYTCFGQWLQDFRPLGDWGLVAYSKDEFRSGTELQRPAPWGPMEKNFFVFWDKDNQTYVHHDTAPKRVFAKLSPDGSVGPDLAPKAAFSDDRCLDKLLPKLGPGHESIHQATNSLSITLCKRADPSCKPDDTNTFIFQIFQHKLFYNFHGSYEPYVMLFHQRAPFEIYAMCTKPLWIHGRRRKSDKVSEMFYVVSMSWKQQSQTYHGYLDDTLFLSFGIEDRKTAGIDVLASDVLANLGTCDSQP